MLAGKIPETLGKTEPDSLAELLGSPLPHWPPFYTSITVISYSCILFSGKMREEML